MKDIKSMLDSVADDTGVPDLPDTPPPLPDTPEELLPPPLPDTPEEPLPAPDTSLAVTEDKSSKKYRDKLKRTALKYELIDSLSTKTSTKNLEKMIERHERAYGTGEVPELVVPPAHTDEPVSVPSEGVSVPEEVPDYRDKKSDVGDVVDNMNCEELFNFLRNLRAPTLLVIKTFLQDYKIITTYKEAE